MTARGSAPAYETEAAVHATTIAHAKQSRTLQSRTMTILPASQPGFHRNGAHANSTPGQPLPARLAERTYALETPPRPPQINRMSSFPRHRRPPPTGPTGERE